MYDSKNEISNTAKTTQVEIKSALDSIADSIINSLLYDFPQCLSKKTTIDFKSKIINSEEYVIHEDDNEIGDN